MGCPIGNLARGGTSTPLVGLEGEDKPNMNEQDVARFSELTKGIEASRAWEVHKRQHLLQLTFAIFAGNFRDLEGHLRAFSDPSMHALWDESRRDQLNQYLGEVARHLHNALAASVTLVDHTRATVKDLYKDNAFLREYQQKANETFGASGLSHFVHDLRNYTLHKELPTASAQMKFSSGRDPDGEVRGQPSLDTSIRLNVAAMAQWDGFTRPSRDFIGTLPDEVDLLSLLSGYRDLVVGFYEWFGTRQAEIHAEDAEAVGRLQDELRALFIRNGLPVPPETVGTN